jgi:hypothetical protein
MALKHELRMSGLRIPKLDASILGTAEYPMPIRCEGNAKHEVLDSTLC